MTDTQPKAARPPRQEQEPASEEVTEVSPGVLRMQLPIWMPGLGHVNMYGLVDDRGLTVIDPGLPGPQSWKALKQRLKTAGLQAQRRAHRGGHALASRPLRRRGPHRARDRRRADHAPRVLHVDGEGPEPRTALTEGEAKRAEVEAAALAQSLDVEPDELPTINDDADVVHDDTLETEATSSPWGAITPWGTTNQGPPLKRKLMIRAMRMLFTPPEPTQRVHHGARIRMGGRDWFAVHTPGHTVDHICAWDPESGVLLTGDHVLPSITPHVSGVRHADSLKSYLATLDLVARLDGVKLGLPAHGHPFTDVPGRARDPGAPRRAHGAVARRRARDRAGDRAGALARGLPEAALGHDGRERDLRPPRAHGERRHGRTMGRGRHAPLPGRRSIMNRTFS